MSKNTEHTLISKILVAVERRKLLPKSAEMKRFDSAKKNEGDLIALYIVAPNINFSQAFYFAEENGQKIVDEVKNEALAKNLNGTN